MSASHPTLYRRYVAERAHLPLSVRVGLTLSDAVRILLTRIVSEGGLPAGLASDQAAYDAWFRAKIREALDDTRPAVPHEKAMQDAQALIDRRRRAQA